MYKLFTDKTELFECDINISGASLSNTQARLVIETPELTLLFKGEVDSKGKCVVPIKKSPKNKIQESSGPIVKVSGIKDESITLSEKQHIINILKLLVKEDISLDNLSFKKNKLNKIIAEYVGSNPIEKTGTVINKVVKVLSKRK